MSEQVQFRDTVEAELLRAHRNLREAAATLDRLYDQIVQMSKAKEAPCAPPPPSP